MIIKSSDLEYESKPVENVLTSQNIYSALTGQNKYNLHYE